MEVTIDFHAENTEDSSLILESLATWMLFTIQYALLYRSQKDGNLDNDLNNLDEITDQTSKICNKIIADYMGNRDTIDTKELDKVYEATIAWVIRHLDIIPY